MLQSCHTIGQYCPKGAKTVAKFESNKFAVLLMMETGYSMEIVFSAEKLLVWLMKPHLFDVNVNRAGTAQVTLSKELLEMSQVRSQTLICNDGEDNPCPLKLNTPPPAMLEVKAVFKEATFNREVNTGS